MAKKLKLTKSKAKEMLKNPPHGKALTDKQEHYFQAVAHGWVPSKKYGGTTGIGTVPMYFETDYSKMTPDSGKFGSYNDRDTGYYKHGGYLWQTTPHMKHGGMPAYGQSFPEANWWGYKSTGPSQFTLPYQLDIKLPPPPEREGPIPTYRNEINSTDYEAATFKAGGRVKMKFRGEKHEIYQDGDVVYVNHPDTKPGKDKGKWKKFNATKEVGAQTIGQAEHAIEEWHNANPGKYEFGGNVTTGQWAILDDEEVPEAGKGYIVKRSNARKGKTHVVIGPDGTKKYFGDSKLGQHPDDPERKKAFYARHKKNLANNPYFRAFARKTWEYGGEVTEDTLPEEYKQGGLIKRADGSYSQRGLWDNIRANKGSGKKPTKEMLAQERKIKMKEKKAGMGMRLDLNPLPVMPVRTAQDGTAVEGYAPDGTPIYRGGTLPEVEVVAQKPKSFRDFTDRYINDLSDRYSKDLLGSLFALPVDAVLSLPQAAATYALSDNRSLIPSEALGIKNPYGAFATNVVLDPSNLIGAGLVDDAFKISGKLKGFGRTDFTPNLEGIGKGLPGSRNTNIPYTDNLGYYTYRKTPVTPAIKEEFKVISEYGPNKSLVRNINGDLEWRENIVTNLEDPKQLEEFYKRNPQMRPEFPIEDIKDPNITPFKFENKEWYKESSPIFVNPEDRAISELTSGTSFGERSLLSGQNLRSQEQLYFDKLFAKHSKDYYDALRLGMENKLDDIHGLIMQEAQKEGYTPDQALKYIMKSIDDKLGTSKIPIKNRTFQKFLYEEGQRPVNRAMFFGNPEVEVQGKGYKLLTDKTPFTRTTNEQEIINLFNENPEANANMPIAKFLNKIKEKNTKEWLKMPKGKKYTGSEAYQTVSPNKYGGKISLKNKQAKGWQIID